MPHTPLLISTAVAAAMLARRIRRLPVRRAARADAELDRLLSHQQRTTGATRPRHELDPAAWYPSAIA